MRIRRNPAVDRGKIAHICRKVKLRGKRRGGGKAGRHGDMLYPCLRFRGSILTSCPSGCLLEPAVVKAGAESAAPHQFFMRSAFDHVAVAHDEDQVSVFNRRKAVRNHKAGAAFRELVHCPLDQKLSTGIDR